MRRQSLVLSMIGTMAWGGSIACSAPSASLGAPRASQAPVAVAPVVDEPELDPIAELEAVLGELGITRSADARERVEDAKAAGLDELSLRAAVRQLYAECLSRRVKEGPCEDPQEELPKIALALLEGMARADSIPLLVALEARQDDRDRSEAIDMALRREMGASLQSCAPVENEAVDARAAQLGDFLVFDRKGRALVAREPTARELDDLAYFLEVVGEAKHEVGHAEEDEAASASRSPALDLQRELRVKLRERVELAQLRGDIAGVYESARAYVESLGYPGALRVAEESVYGPGGARYSYVMRDLAHAAEMLGHVEEAASLYRRADPGGGACGTSADYVRGDQIRGLIRSSERAGLCREVIPERLLDWDGANYDESQMTPEQRASVGYGPERLTAAGFDVPRLYRGALVTRNRELPEAELRLALARLPLERRVVGLARLERLGPEAWEQRVRAVEGLADVGGRPALDPLLALLPHSGARLRERTIQAIGSMAARAHMGPCDGDESNFLNWSSSNIWSRHVEVFAETCEDALDDAQADAVATQLWAYAGADQDIDVRLAAVEAMEQLLAPAAVSRLERVARREAKRAARCEAKPDPDEDCWEPQALASQAQTALESFAVYTQSGDGDQ